MTSLKNMSYEKKKGLYGYGFIALWFIGALMFFIIPLFESFYYSFHEVTPETGYMDVKPLIERVAGEEKTNIFLNYKNAFLTDPHYRQYLVEVLGDMALNLPIIVIFSLFVAIIINQKFRGRTFARAVFFLPVIIATGPVMEAGRIFSTASRPQKRTMTPAAMEIKPERMIPNCAY